WFANSFGSERHLQGFPVLDRAAADRQQDVAQEQAAAVRWRAGLESEQHQPTGLLRHAEPVSKHFLQLNRLRADAEAGAPWVPTGWGLDGRGFARCAGGWPRGPRRRGARSACRRPARRRRPGHRRTAPATGRRPRARRRRALRLAPYATRRRPMRWRQNWRW